MMRSLIFEGHLSLLIVPVQLQFAPSFRFEPFWFRLRELTAECCFEDCSYDAFALVKTFRAPASRIKQARRLRRPFVTVCTPEQQSRLAALPLSVLSNSDDLAAAPADCLDDRFKWNHRLWWFAPLLPARRTPLTAMNYLCNNGAERWVVGFLALPGYSQKHLARCSRQAVSAMTIVRKLAQLLYAPKIESHPLRMVLPLALRTPTPVLQIVSGDFELMAIGAANLQ